MAEAAVENPSTNANKFYCHQCTAEIKPKLPDFTCPQCDNGFIEEITEDLNTGSTSTHQGHDQDPASQFAELWGRAFLDSFRNHGAERDEGNTWNREREFDDESLEGTSRRQRRVFPPQRVSFRRTRPIRNQYLQGLFQYFIDRIGDDVGGGGPIPISSMERHGTQRMHWWRNFVPLHGNPDDYAWGAGGLDSIITQLLNQLESSGAPPASAEKIDALPVVTVSQEQVDKVLQCSVCMEDFQLKEEVRKLPCDHHFHTDCIVPWLKMHGTCPVCRKDLNGDDQSLKDDMPPLDENFLGNSNSESDMT